MAKDYDPLTFIPSPDVIRAHLERTLLLAERLKILLDVSEKIHAVKVVDKKAKDA